VNYWQRRVAGLALILFCGIGPVGAAGLKVLSGHVPPVVPTLTATGLVAATNQLRLAMGLPLHHVPALNDFIGRLYDPASPDFHHFLTLTEFADRFGPTEQDYAAVKAFARTNGLVVTGTYANRLVLDVRGPAGAVEKAFHLTLRTYRHPTEARDFFAPDTEPTVAADLPLVDVQGLSNLSRPRPMLHRRTAAQGTRQANSYNGTAPDGSGNYFGDDFRNAYAPDTVMTGAGQVIGLFEADGYYPSDIAAYAAAAGGGRVNILIQTNLLDDYDGTPTAAGNPEVSLDIELAMAMAPGLAKIVLYQGNINKYLPNDILNAMLADSATVKNLSSSWHWNRSQSVTTATIFTNMAAVGQTYFDASGDSDAYTSSSRSANPVDGNSSSLENEPASCPIITQVGGTTLTMNGAGVSYNSETVWNWGYDSAAGEYVGSSGGISSYYAIPSWQANINMPARGGSASFRNIPDVALTADNVFVDFGDGTNGEYGGTSCAAPLWAAFTAMANQQAVTGGQPPMGFINPALYAIAAGTNYASCFNDVTTGSNTWSKSPSLFFATNGYDLCTGLGTPNGASLLNALAGPAGLVVSPLTDSATGVAGGPFGAGFENILLINPGSSPLTWSVFNLPAWLQISATNGVLGAGGKTSLAFSLTGAAATLGVGTYTAGLIFSNATLQVVQTGWLTLTVNQPMTVSPTNVFLSAGGVGGPFSVTAQTYWLTNLSVAPLAWSLINTSAWLNVDMPDGTLAGGGQTAVTVSLATAADSLPAGSNMASVLVTDDAGLVASLPFTLNVGQSLVVNGGFETGDFTGWTLVGDTVTGGPSGFIYDAVESLANDASYGFDVVHSGNYGAFLGDDQLATLAQTLATAPGQNYLLSLWLDNPAAGSLQVFQVNWGGTMLYDVTNPPAFDWTNLEFIVTAAGTTTLLQFGAENDPSYFGLDDVSVTPVPPPEFSLAQPPPPNNASFNLTWSTVPGVSYQVLYSTNLLDTNWINLGGPLTAVTNTLSVSDTNALLVSPQRFYRLVEQP